MSLDKACGLDYPVGRDVSSARDRGRLKEIWEEGIAHALIEGSLSEYSTITRLPDGVDKVADHHDAAQEHANEPQYVHQWPPP
eukprot:971173-Amorphochlora_amoeboformis.AAC.1